MTRTSDRPQTLHALGDWRTPKVSQKVAMTIVEDIVANDLKAGDRLPAEAEMMDRFKISRTSLREGLRLLETYGVILIRQGQKGGPEIGPLNPVDIARTLALFLRLSGATYRDLFSARLLIEPVMSRIAAERKGADRMKALQAVMEKEHKATAEDYFQASNDFHQLVSGLSGNPVLDLIGQALRALYADRIFRGAFPEESLSCCKKAHPDIGAAILAGDGLKAEKLMADHMAELNKLVNKRAAWFMNERISWEA